jgi:hypothetical protein
VRHKAVRMLGANGIATSANTAIAVAAATTDSTPDDSGSAQRRGGRRQQALPLQEAAPQPQSGLVAA